MFGTKLGSFLAVEHFGSKYTLAAQGRSMLTPHIPKSSSWRGLFGRFGPALTLAALTALAAMFVVSSLNGCRRNADSNHSKDLVGKPLSDALHQVPKRLRFMGGKSERQWR